MKIWGPLTGCIFLAATAHGAVISDDFNRTDSANLGTASSGGSWVESNANDALLAIAGNALNINLTNASRWAYIGNLSGISNYTISFDINLSSANTTSNAWIKISPVAAVPVNWWTTTGWMIRRRSGNKMDLIYYQGGETDVQADVMAMDEKVHVEITVTDNTSTITIGNQTFTTPTGKNLARPTDGSNAYFWLQFSADSGQTVNGTIDNLTVSAVPEPGALGLLSCTGLGLLIRTRK